MHQGGVLKGNAHLKELEKSKRIKKDQGYQEISRKKSLEEKFLEFVKFV